MRRSSRLPALWAPALAVATSAALAACSHPAPRPPLPPLIIGSAPATATGHIKTNQPVQSSTGYAAPDDWPNACDLLTDQDIRSIFPQATGPIQHNVTDRTFDFSNGAGMTVPDAECAITFRLPTSDDDPSADVIYHGQTIITTDVEAVGDPNMVRSNGQGDPDVVQSCTYRAGFTANICGRIEVAASVEHLNLPSDSLGHDVDRFQTNGKITSFSAKRFEAEKTFEDTHLNPEIINAVLAKLPRS
jgi:hypothetical protein